jgi:hypothetical protein
MKMKEKWNQTWLGFIPGIIVPLVTFYLIYLSLSEDQSIIEYYNKLASTHVLTKFLSLTVVPNLLLFFIFIWLDFLKTARGVLGATMFYAFVIVILMVI